MAVRADNRIEAIDIFRGIAIAGMVLVNLPGSWSHIYPVLRHADWHGLGGADLVFPFFLFISGSAMFFSLRRRASSESSAPVKKILLRVLIIFAAGLFLNAFPFTEPVSGLRIMGVLQRIALAWGIAVAACLLMERRALLIISALVLILYWILLYAAGDLSLEGNLPRAIDMKILGPGHLWAGKGIPFDPENILGTLPAAVTVITGYLAGSVIGEGPGVFRRLLAAGAISIAAGVLWGTVYPVNKYLWTGSYILLTSGIACSLLSLLYLLVEEKGYGKLFFPLKVFGRNPLLLYIISSLWVQVLAYLVRFRTSEGGTVSGYGWLYQHLFVPLAGQMPGSLLFSLCHLALFWLILYSLYRRGTFIRV